MLPCLRDRDICPVNLSQYANIRHYHDQVRAMTCFYLEYMISYRLIYILVSLYCIIRTYVEGSSRCAGYQNCNATGRGGHLCVWRSCEAETDASAPANIHFPGTQRTP
jgi:hypothetical protein